MVEEPLAVSFLLSASRRQEVGILRSLMYCRVEMTRVDDGER